ncbi:3-hydroxyacyl-ACP dehydratase FabZ [Diaminobutyricibacter sp. McL0618]|uniref:3-hydroxyacyl-ACP dehydratase FabZ n=1 Tax=Leifsonia sp. McL0618 TaxID=3415677 RepID=UPI003CF5BF2A
MHPATLNVSDFFPHRHPFLLIDQVESIGEGRAVATKAVTRTEPWFTGHFPDRPVFPGVLLLEAMAQTGRFLNSLDRRLISARLARIDSVKFFREVVPGETIRMEAWRIGELGALSKFHVDANVRGERCASAEFSVHSVMGELDGDSSTSELGSALA